jgi:hypothetical protein
MRLSVRIHGAFMVATTTKTYESTMAPTDQKSTKIASTTAQPKPMSAYTPMAVIRKRNGFKAPPATRHRAVLYLQDTIPLFEMQAYSSRNLEEIVWSSRNVTQSLMVCTITTGVRKPVEDDPLYVELLVGFYPPEDVENRFEFPNKIQHDVIVPAGWTPKMYLGELSRSLSRYPMVLLSMISINGKN